MKTLSSSAIAPNIRTLCFLPFESPVGIELTIGDRVTCVNHPGDGGTVKHFLEDTWFVVVEVNGSTLPIPAGSLEPMGWRGLTRGDRVQITKCNYPDLVGTVATIESIDWMDDEVRVKGDDGIDRRFPSHALQKCSSVPEPPETSDRPYSEYFALRQEWHQRQRNQETLISKPIESRYFDGFEKALNDADLYTFEKTLEDLVLLPSTKSKIKVLQRRQKQLVATVEQVHLSGSNWQGILIPDQLQGIHLTFVLPAESQWRHHITDSESIWEVADYFYEMVRQHFDNDEPVFVGSRDQDIKVQLRQPSVAQPIRKVQEGDRVRLYGDCLPDTLEWVGDAGLKGEVGEAIVFTSGVGDGIYRGKAGIITEVHDQRNFTATFAGTIDGYPGDSFTIPVERSSIARRLKYRELSDETLFDVVQVHGLGIELSYEGAEFRVGGSAIREILERPSVPEPDETTPLEPVQEEALENLKTSTGIQAGDRVKVIINIPTRQQYVGQILEVAEVKTLRCALLHLGDGRTGAFTISEFIRVDDSIAPDNSDPVIIENPAETITTDEDGRVVIQPEFRVRAAVVADFS